MADLGDFIDIAADIAELFFESRSEMRKNAKPPASSTVARPTSDRQTQSKDNTSDTNFRGSPESDESITAELGRSNNKPPRPSEIANSTEAEYCETCIEEKGSPQPKVRLNSRNLREAFILSELIAPPLSRRGRRIF